jgi:protein phosphatase
MAELPNINLALYAQTDVGRVRSGNEDNFLILDLSSGKSWTASEEEPQDLLTYTQGFYGSLLAVSDGMGGALAGEVASRMAVETVRDRMLQLQAHDVYSRVTFHERLRLSIEEANLLINDESQTNPAHKGLGATFTAVAMQGMKLFFAQVGDSRAYLIRGDGIYRITKDQSLVQQLIDAGQITEEEAETHSYRNVILQALGAHSNVNVEVNSLPLCNLDTLVLCSDGLSGKLHQEEIAQIVLEASDFKSACQRLIDVANDRGGEDNITVVIAQFSGSGLELPSKDEIEPLSLARSPDTPTEINWRVGATTDPLKAPTDSGSADAKATEPLPTPPAQSKPFTAKIQRNSADLPLTNDLSDRRGPITAVFAPEDFEQEMQSVAAKDAAKAAEQLHSAKTEPLDSRQTRPLGSPTTQLPQTKSGSESTNNKRGTPAPKASEQDGNSRTNMLILIGLILLGAGGLGIGLTTYFRQQEQARLQQEQEQQKRLQENQNQKDGQIGRLREKIAEISKRLQAADKPTLREKRAIWNEKLEKLAQELDSVRQIPPDQLPEINRACDEIGKELSKIEEEVNSLQGLLPRSETNRDPIKV